MSAFKALRDVSNNFEEDVRRASNELFSIRIDEPFEDIIAKKLTDLSLYRSKLRLLQAKSCAASSPTVQTDEQTTIANYTDAVKWKIVEQQTVKAVTQSHHVKAVIISPDRSLSLDMLDRKEKIIEQLTKFKEKDMELRELTAVLGEREQHLEGVRREWENQHKLLQDRRSNINDASEEHLSSPLSMKLHKLEGKLSSLRALLARLASARGGGYDWMADPHRRLRALRLARQ